MTTAHLNPIQLKVASLTVDKTYFIHPGLDARDFLEAKFEENLFGFELAGIEYLISDSHGGNDVTGNHLHKIFINNGNSWLSSTIFLTDWEWSYLVRGYEVVNSENYHAFVTRTSGKPEKYRSEKQVEEDLKDWESKGSAEMVEYIKDYYVPVRLTKDGVWDDGKPRCPHCHSDLSQDYSVTRTYINKDGGDDVVAEGRYEGKDQDFESQYFDGFADGRYDCQDDSDACVNCGGQL